MRQTMPTEDLIDPGQLFSNPLFAFRISMSPARIPTETQSPIYLTWSIGVPDFSSLRQVRELIPTVDDEGITDNKSRSDIQRSACGHAGLDGCRYGPRHAASAVKIRGPAPAKAYEQTVCRAGSPTTMVHGDQSPLTTTARPFFSGRFGPGMTTSRTPFRNSAVALEGSAPSGNGMLRKKLPYWHSL